MDNRSTMKISEMNWMQVEDYLRRDDRAVLPLGCTEQHAYLSLSTDSLLAERMALEAAEPLGVPVFPVLPYGITPYFMSYPGTVTLHAQTYLSVVRDILDSLLAHGFKRIVVVNGHGGNTPASVVADEAMRDHPGLRVKWHNWWNAPRAFAKVKEIDSVASHASWMENFPWTRLATVTMSKEQKPMADLALLRQLDPQGTRALLGDGNFGGYYQRQDEEMLTIWNVGVEETRALIADGWV
jgi:creatinine amidohydrolase